jgi:hypothetical protein
MNEMPPAAGAGLVIRRESGLIVSRTEAVRIGFPAAKDHAPKPAFPAQIFNPASLKKSASISVNQRQIFFRSPCRILRSQ